MPDAERRILRYFALPLGLLLLFFSCSYLFPESNKVKKEAAPKSRSIYSVRVNAVVVNATVTDRAGNPVKDLTINDFKVYDDGKPQAINTLALESFAPPEAEEAKAPSAAVSATMRTATEKKTVDSRMISVVIDDLTMETQKSVLEYPRLVDSLKEFVKNDMGPADQVAILSGSRKVQLPFTNDKQRLLAELASVPTELNIDTTQRPCPDVTDLEAWHMSKDVLSSPYFRDLIKECLNKVGGVYSIDDTGYQQGGVRDAEGMMRIFSLRTYGDSEYRTRNLLDTIRQNIRALRHFEGTRMIVLFSDGFISEKTTRASYQLQELVDLALRSGIVLNTVSTRGVRTYIDENFDSAQTWKVLMGEDDTRAQHASLAQMAEETGGVFFHDNSLYKPLQTIARRRSSYYVLTYPMPPHKSDGGYHQIKLEINRPGLQVSYRKGYFTPKEELTFENRKKEDIIDAINAPGNMNEIPMTLSYNYSQEDDFTYAVSFITNVNIRGLQFLEEESRRKNQISLFLVAYDETDRYVSGLEKSIDFQLLESSYTDLRDRGLTSRVELKLPLGRYKIKAVVRESVQGKMGSVAKSVEIP